MKETVSFENRKRFEKIVSHIRKNVDPKELRSWVHVPGESLSIGQKSSVMSLKFDGTKMRMNVVRVEDKGLEPMIKSTYRIRELGGWRWLVNSDEMEAIYDKADAAIVTRAMEDHNILRDGVNWTNRNLALRLIAALEKHVAGNTCCHNDDCANATEDWEDDEDDEDYDDDEGGDEEDDDE